MFPAAKLLLQCAVVLISVKQCLSLKVAIVGSGIGGASTAHHLRRLLGNDVSIHVYDGGPVGGRTRSIEMDGRFYEAGASIIHQRNRYVREFVELLNLTVCAESSGAVLSIFNGVKPAFEGSEWSWLTTAKMMWRYGPDLLRLKWKISAMMDEFDVIYKMQEEGRAFADLDSLLNAWNKKYQKYMGLSLADWLQEEGFSERFIDEIANGATRCNYNQRANEIHALVGQVSLAAFLPGLFSVVGGNSLVARGLLKLSGATVVPSAVAEVQETSGTLSQPSYSLRLASGAVHDGFGFVVLALPRYPSSAAWPRFVNVEPSLPPPARTPYQPVTATFVRGALAADHFRLPAGVPYAVLMAGRARTDPVSSVAPHRPADHCGHLEESTTAWKVFSSAPGPLPEPLLGQLFARRDAVATQEWPGAYPRYAVPTRIDGLRFAVAPGLVWLAPIEQVASAMEMSAIAGANAALLVAHASRGAGDRIAGSPGRGRAGSDEL